jgi:hypothetical protein
VPGELAFRLGRIDGGGRLNVELSELFRLSAGTPTPSVPVFFVQASPDFLGIAGGVPGPWGMSGTEGSGVAITVNVLERNGYPIGHVLTHEVLHYLGLFHTSEVDGTVVDAIDDTPDCGVDRDDDRDGSLSPMECVGFGADNAMFWAPDPAVGGLVTDGQLAIIRRALLLQ